MFTKFILVGPRTGQTVELGGYQFVNGVTQVPAAETANHQLILSRYHSAHPEHEFVRTADGMKHYSELQQEPVPAVVPVAQVPPDTNGESFGSDDLDESLPEGVSE